MTWSWKILLKLIQTSLLKYNQIMEKGQLLKSSRLNAILQWFHNNIPLYLIFETDVAS